MLNFLKRVFGGQGEEAPPREASLQQARVGQERAEEGLRQSEEHFAELVAGVRDYAVFLLDRQGNVITWNAGAERIKGYQAEDIIGQHFSRFYPKEAVTSGWPAHELSVASVTGRFEDEGWRIRKDGSRFWASVVITALRDESGEVRGFLKITRDMTDRKQAEEKLRLSEERLRLMVANVKDYAIFMLDPEGRVATWNEGAQRINGYTAEEIIGQHFSRFYPQEAVERGWPDEELRRAAADGRFEDEGWRIRQDGSRFWANVVITALRDESGVLRGFGKVTRDLTDRKQAEENARRLLQEEAARKTAEEAAQEIERQREQLHVTLASIGDAVIVTDQNGIITFMNPVAMGLTGWDEAAGQPLERVFHIVNENTRLVVENPALRALREGIPIGLANHTVLIARDGSERPIDDCAAPIRVRQEAIIGAVLVFRDITKRRQAETALRTSEQRFRQLADAMPQIVWTAGPDGVVDYYNRRWHEFTGFSAEMGNEGWRAILHPDDGPAAAAKWDVCLRAGTPFEMEIRLRDRRSGGYHWHLMRTLPVRAEDGTPVRWYGTATDINEQKRSGDAARFLAEASAALAALVDYESTLQRVASLAVPYFADWAAVDVMDEDGSLRRLAVAHQDLDKVRLAQELFCRYPPDPKAASGSSRVLRTGEPEIIEEITDEMLVKGARDEEYLRLARSLGLRSYICVPLIVSGKMFGVITFVTAESGRTYSRPDLSLAQDLCHRAAVAIENANLYRVLQEEDKRKTEFLAVLAHELRNPLAPLRNGLHIMRLRGDSPEAVQQARTMMERQLQHLARLVDDLLDVSRISRGKIELRKERITLASVVGSAVEACEPLIQQQEDELTVALPDEPVYVDADKTRLAQAVCNLLSNAAKYSNRGSRIWLTAAREGDEAVLRVKDTGVGIPADMLPRVFDMFTQVDRSLEKSQGGLGVGLTIVKQLIEMHGGNVEAHSEGYGRGSEFILRLPIVPAPVQEQSEKGGKQAAPSIAQHRILVADDNVDAADSLAMMLQLMGQEVRTAHNGQEAVDVAAALRPDLILLDIGMPKLNGYDACRRIREQPWGKEVVIVALTGWGQDEDKRRSREAGFTSHLVKPVDPAALDKLLAELKSQKA